jgi:hypothetical protein
MKPILDLLDLLPGWLWAAICAGALAWGSAQTWRVHSLKSDVADLKREKAEGESQRLREANREVARLVDVTNQLNEANREQLATIDDLERRARAAGVRVTKAERDAAIAAGSAEAVSRYAIVAGDTYQACRDEYRTLGYEAARGSAAAHTLKQWADEVTPSRPTPPTPPSQP